MDVLKGRQYEIGIMEFSDLFNVFQIQEFSNVDLCKNTGVHWLMVLRPFGTSWIY